MKHSPDELPESARRAFRQYPHIEASPAFNRGVLEALAGAQSKRRQSLVGRLEEFLGLGLWQFVGSGALGALLPGVVLSVMMLSGQSHKPQKPATPTQFPTSWPGFSPFGDLRREHQWA